MKKQLKLRKVATLLLFLCIAIVLEGCISSRIVDYTLASTKPNIDISKLGNLKKGERAQGERKFMSRILIFPTSSRHLDLERALTNAIESVPGCSALLDVVVYVEVKEFLFFQKTKHIVEGTPLIDSKTSMKTHNESGYSKIELDEASEVKHVQSFTQNEYTSLQSGIAKRAKVVKRIPKYVRK